MSPHPPRSQADIEEMRARYIQGEEYATIGATFAISKQRVAQLVNPRPAERRAHHKAKVAARGPQLSAAERARVRRHQAKPPHPCPVCGTLTTRKTYCSPEHAEVARREKHATYQARSIIRNPSNRRAADIRWAENHLRKVGEL